MSSINKDDILVLHHIAPLKEQTVKDLLNNEVYSSKNAWQQFVHVLFLVLGVGFLLAGIIFFFAYNWDGLHKFAKMGVAQLGLLVTTVLAIIPRLKPLFRQMMLFASVVLVGVLFAIFGQVYQTGANTYEYFMAWAIFSIIWVLCSKFPPLWLFWLIIAHLSFFFFTNQAVKDFDPILSFGIPFVIDALIIFFFLYQSSKQNKIVAPHWLMIILSIGCVTFATVGVIGGLFDSNFLIGVLLLLVAIAYFGAIMYALKAKSLFYISIVWISGTIIVCGLFAKLFSRIDEFTFVLLLMTVMVIFSFTVGVATLMSLQKKWNNHE